MKEQSSQQQEIGKTMQGLEQLFKQTQLKKKDDKAKSNKNLVDQLSKIEDDLKTNKSQISAEDRQAKKRAYMLGKNAVAEKSEVEPQASFLTSPSQPETVPELDEEDDDEYKHDEDLLGDELQIEETTDERMQLLLNSGEKKNRDDGHFNFSATIIEQEV